jgi:hypothetical protein
LQAFKVSVFLIIMEEQLSQSVKIGIIRGQTNYTEEECVSLLEQHNGDYISIIKIYMGIPVVKKAPPIKSVNQEIYKQLRKKMDIQEFLDAHPPTLG